jgi:hypothetical protein
MDKQDLQEELEGRKIVAVQWMGDKLYIFTGDQMFTMEAPRPVKWYHRAWERLKGWFGR